MTTVCSARAESLRQRYVSAMILSGAGDAIGYKGGDWEFCRRGRAIYEELLKLGGLENIKVKLPTWPVSDDTVMHLATADALLEVRHWHDLKGLFLRLAHHYKECMKDMAGRAPGLTCSATVHDLKPLRPNGYQIKFNPRGGGCGAAMRSMCIGLRYPRVNQLETLIAISVESGRMTHHHPTGFLGSLASALLTSFAVQDRPLESWGKHLMETLPKALEYVRSTGHCVTENEESWDYFETAWQKYLKQRGIEDGTSQPTFPEKYDFEERDKFVKSVSFSGCGGASGHDAPMLAYDALLASRNNWTELAHRAMIHGGDSDSTGVIAACWFGVLYGFEGVPEGNYSKLEYRDRLERAAGKLYEYSLVEEESKDPSAEN